MSVSITISNEAKLNKVKNLLGTKTESETVGMALEKVIEEFETKRSDGELPDDFFEDLFAEKTNLSEGESVQAIIKEREEANF